MSSLRHSTRAQDYITLKAPRYKTELGQAVYIISALIIWFHFQTEAALCGIM